MGVVPGRGLDDAARRNVQGSPLIQRPVTALLVKHHQQPKVQQDHQQVKFFLTVFGPSLKKFVRLPSPDRLAQNVSYPKYFRAISAKKLVFFLIIFFLYFYFFNKSVKEKLNAYIPTRMENYE